MSTVDERIVSMKFENAEFQKGTADTVQSLEDLKKSLKMEGVADNVDSIASKFSVFGAVAFSGIQKLVGAAIDAGQKLAGAILDPLVEGGKKRALNIEQAKFQFRGLGMDVEKSMAAALSAVKGTAYGLDEAAKAAGVLGASQVSLKFMPTALRAISGAAAMTGSSYSDMADVFTKVAGQGRLMGDDLNRLGVRGLNAAATLGQAMHKPEGEIRKMVSKGKISFEQFAKIMNNAFGDQATKANETYAGSLANMRAALARIGAAFATVDFENQRDKFNALTPLIDNVAAAIKPLVDVWTQLTKLDTKNFVVIMEALNMKAPGQDLPPLFIGLRNLIQFVLDVAKPIKEAFDEIFPPATTMQIVGMANAFRKLTENFKIGEKTSDNIKRTFKGLFALFDIGMMIIQGFFGVVGRLFSTLFGNGAGSANGGLLNFTGNIGDFIVKVRDAMKSGDGFAKAMKVIGDILTWPIVQIQKLVAAVKESNPDLTVWGQIWKVISDTVKQFYRDFKPIIDWVVGAVKGFGQRLKDAFNNVTLEALFGDFAGAAGVGIFAGFLLGLRQVLRAIAKWRSALDFFSGGLLNNIKLAFGGLTTTMRNMQDQIKSKTLMNIAIAIAILTASIVALSLIDQDKLAGALAAIGVMMYELMTTLKAFDTTVKTKDLLKMQLIASGMIAMSVAMLIFAGAVAIMGSLDLESLIKGLAGMAIGLKLIMAAAGKMTPKETGNMIVAGIGIIALSVAMLIFAKAVSAFAAISWEGLAKGGVAIAGLLGIIVLFADTLGKNSAKLAVGSIGVMLIASAMLVLAKAVALFGAMDMDTISKGMLAIAGSLAIIGIAMAALPASVLASSAALLIVSIALEIITDVLGKMAQMSWEEIGKSMVVLAGSLAILAGAMALMGFPLVLAGAAGLLAAGVALLMIAPALKILGSMSWDDIGRGLAVLASALGILALGGVLLIPAIPAFLAIGVAVLMFGTGALLAGIGLTAMAVAIVALAAASTVGVAAIKMVVLSLVELIPAIAIGVAAGITAFIVALAQNAGEIFDAFVTLGNTIIDAIISFMPKIGELIQSLVDLMVQVLVVNIPQLANAGYQMLLGLLLAMRAYMPKIIPVSGDLIVMFIKGLGDQSLKIAKAGGDAVIKFLNGIGDYVKANSDAFVSAGSKLFRAIVDGISAAIRQGGSDLRYAGQKIASALWDGAMNFLQIHSPSKKFQYEMMPWIFKAITLGAKQGSGQAQTAGKSIGIALYTGMQKSLNDISDSVMVDPNMNPTITPVLDLSSVKKDASQLPSILAPNSLSLDSTISQANQTASAVDGAKDYSDTTDDTTSGGDTFNFVQNNTSPKALSSAELYRQTKNQISTAKIQIETKKGAPV